MPSSLHAKVERFEIESRQRFAEGKEFGETGTYDLLQGIVSVCFYCCLGKLEINILVTNSESGHN